MKISIFAIVLVFLNSLICVCQDIKPAPDDKAVVYFARPSSLGLVINFSYFDSTRLIGKFNGSKYIRYECKPGVHLFWARSENRDFVEADVEAGKIYFILAIPKMGVGKAGVRLVPVDPVDLKKMKKIFRLLNKKPSELFTEEELKIDTKEEVIARGLEKYKELKARGEIILRLEKTMFYSKN